jgi:hypothetical protein
MPLNDKDFDGVILSMTVDINKKIFSPAEKIEMVVTVYNGGEQDLPHTSLTMVVPSLVQFISISPELKTHISGNSVLFEVGPIPKKDKITATIICGIIGSVTDEIATDIGFTALCDETLVISDEVNFIIKGKRPFNIWQDPALILSVKLSPPIIVNTLHASIHVLNQGDKDAVNTVLTVVLPDHIHLTPTGRGLPEFCKAGHTYLYHLGTIKSKEMIEYSIDYLVDKADRNLTPFQVSCSVAADESNTTSGVKIAQRLFCPTTVVLLGVEIENKPNFVPYLILEAMQNYPNPSYPDPVTFGTSPRIISIKYEISDPEIQGPTLSTDSPYNIKVFETGNLNNIFRDVAVDVNMPSYIENLPIPPQNQHISIQVYNTKDQTDIGKQIDVNIVME